MGQQQLFLPGHYLRIHQGRLLLVAPLPVEGQGRIEMGGKKRYVHDQFSSMVEP
jgi:hypothetical protein